LNIYGIHADNKRGRFIVKQLSTTELPNR